MLLIEKKISEFISQNHLLEIKDTVLVATSGGPDSLALLHYLTTQRIEGIKVIAAHVDHMIRGDASEQDKLFVEQFCIDRNIPFVSTKIDILEKMDIDGKGMQETARRYRYKFLERMMEVHECTKLATGHHGDDQVETILMRLTRGSSSEGRAGMSIKRAFSTGWLIHPFLCLTKDDIERYCKFYGLQPRRDPSNEEGDYTRNRFRINMLPFLKQENRNVHKHFQRYSEEAKQDDDFLMKLTVAALNEVVEKSDDKVTLQINQFKQVALPLQRRGIHLILTYLYKEKSTALMAVHLNAILELLFDEHPSGQLDLPLGLKVQRSYGVCTFSFLKSAPLNHASYNMELPTEGNIMLPNGHMINMKRETALTKYKQMSNNSLSLYPNEIQLPLIVRTRQTGDRMSLKGRSGTKKIKDIFIDEKVPLQERDVWPIVTDQTGEILWIPGLKKSRFDIQSPQLQQEYYTLDYT